MAFFHDAHGWISLLFVPTGRFSNDVFGWFLERCLSHLFWRFSEKYLQVVILDDIVTNKALSRH